LTRLWRLAIEFDIIQIRRTRVVPGDTADLVSAALSGAGDPQQTLDLWCGEEGSRSGRASRVSFPGLVPDPGGIRMNCANRGIRRVERVAEAPGPPPGSCRVVFRRWQNAASFFAPHPGGAQGGAKVSAFSVTVGAASRRLSDVVVLGPIAHAARDANEVVEAQRTGNNEAACGPAELARGGPGPLSTRGAAGRAGFRAARRGLVPGPRDRIAQGPRRLCRSGSRVLGPRRRNVGYWACWTKLLDRPSSGPASCAWTRAPWSSARSIRWTSGPTWSEAADRLGPDGIEAGPAALNHSRWSRGAQVPGDGSCGVGLAAPDQQRGLVQAVLDQRGVLAWFALDQAAVWSGPTEAVVREEVMVQWTVVRQVVVQPRVLVRRTVVQRTVVQRTVVQGTVVQDAWSSRPVV
jgi:hypothetical protein